MMTARHAVLAIAMSFTASHAHAQLDCGSLDNGFGPFDYRTATDKQRATVEAYHFTENVAQLRKGQSTVRIGGDISYTLRAFPNHPRALSAMAELARREKTETPKGSEYSLACWFERAIRFRPDDAAVRVVLGISLLKSGHRKQAIEQLHLADKLMPDDANVNYNLGLAYFYAGNHDQSLVHAKRAYELGFPLPGLRNMLTKAGKWK